MHICNGVIIVGLDNLESNPDQTQIDYVVLDPLNFQTTLIVQSMCLLCSDHVVIYDSVGFTVVTALLESVDLFMSIHGHNQLLKLQFLMHIYKCACTKGDPNDLDGPPSCNADVYMHS